MICNGINFTDAWVLKFTDVELFIATPMCQRYIEKKIVDRNSLIAFYNLLQELHKPKANDEHTGVQGEIQEDQPESSDRGNSESESRSDSRSAGDTNVKRRKGGRNKVS